MPAVCARFAIAEFIYEIIKKKFSFVCEISLRVKSFGRKLQQLACIVILTVKKIVGSLWHNKRVGSSYKGKEKFCGIIK